MITIREETAFDVAAREALLDAAFEDRLPAEGLSFVACQGGQLIGTVRLWDISAGPGRPALLLGPLAVAAHVRNRGIGAALTRHALAQACRRGHAAVLLVGEPQRGPELVDGEADARVVQGDR